MWDLSMVVWFCKFSMEEIMEVSCIRSFLYEFTAFPGAQPRGQGPWNRRRAKHARGATGGSGGRVESVPQMHL